MSWRAFQRLCSMLVVEVVFEEGEILRFGFLNFLDLARLRGLTVIKIFDVNFVQIEEVGAGKTTLGASLAARLGDTGPHQEPTYAVVEPHEAGDLDLAL